MQQVLDTGHFEFAFQLWLQHPSFISKFMDKLASHLGMPKLAISTANPHSNGIAERSNTDSIKTISVLLLAYPLSWPDLLPSVRFAHMTNICVDTQYSPLTCCLGFHHDSHPDIPRQTPMISLPPLEKPWKPINRIWQCSGRQLMTLQDIFSSRDYQVTSLVCGLRTAEVRIECLWMSTRQAWLYEKRMIWAPRTSIRALLGFLFEGWCIPQNAHCLLVSCETKVKRPLCEAYTCSISNVDQTQRYSSSHSVNQTEHDKHYYSGK